MAEHHFGTGLWFEAASVVVQSSGKVVVAGSRMNGSQFDPLIARFNTDGSLDTTFGSDGTDRLSRGRTARRSWSG